MKKAEYYLQAIGDNNATAIREIYDEYSPMVVKFVMNNSGHVEDARDVFQDAMVVIYKKIKAKDLHLTSSFGTYFFSVCRFIWLRKLKKNKREVVTSSFEERLNVEPNLEDRWIEARKLQLMKKKLASLSDECQELLHLTFKGASGKEIAENLNYSVAFVKGKRFRCKKYLMKAIQDDPEYHYLTEN